MESTVFPYNPRTSSAGGGVAGADGVDGTDGVDGASAYELAVANGFVGTEAEWLESLQGADGVAASGSMIFRGAWDGTDHNIDEVVTHNNILWAATSDPGTTEPAAASPPVDVGGSGPLANATTHTSVRNMWQQFTVNRTTTVSKIKVKQQGTIMTVADRMAIYLDDRTTLVGGISGAPDVFTGEPTFTLSIPAVLQPGTTYRLWSESGHAMVDTTAPVATPEGVVATMGTLFVTGYGENTYNLAFRLHEPAPVPWERIGTVLAGLPTAAALYFAEATHNTAQLIGSSFTTVALPTEVTDPASCFDPGTSIYTTPVAGVYDITATARLDNYAAAGRQLGLGVHGSNADGPWFVWGATNGAIRTTLVYHRRAYFAAGTQLRMYAYSDASGGVNIIEAGLQISLLAQG